MDEPRPGDVHLLRSDGLSKPATEAEISQILTEERHLENACAKLVESANAHGGRDNVSVVLVQLTEGGAPGTPQGPVSSAGDSGHDLAPSRKMHRDATRNFNSRDA